MLCNTLVDVQPCRYNECVERACLESHTPVVLGNSFGSETNRNGVVFVRDPGPQDVVVVVSIS
jgi:hypothetical protein